FPEGDYIKSWYQIAEAGDNLVLNDAGKEYEAALTAYDLQNFLTDPFYVAYFAGLLTIDKWMNEIGYDNVTPETISEKAAAFEGPLIHGPTVIECNKYSEFPNACADGAYFFQYKGDDTFERYKDYLQPLPELQAEYGAK